MDFFTIVDPETGMGRDALVSIMEIIIVSSVVIAGSVLVQVLPDLYKMGSLVFKPRRRAKVPAAPAVTDMQREGRGDTTPSSGLTQRRVPAASDGDAVLAKQPRPATASSLLSMENTSDGASGASGMKRAAAEAVTAAPLPAAAASPRSVGKAAADAQLEKALDEFLAGEDLLDEAITDIVITAATQGAAAPAAKPPGTAAASSKKEAPVAKAEDSDAQREKQLAQRMAKGLFAQPHVAPAPSASSKAVQQPAKANFPVEAARTPAAPPAAEPVKAAAEPAKAAVAEPQKACGDDALLMDALDVVSPTKAAGGAVSSRGPASPAQPPVANGSPKLPAALEASSAAPATLQAPQVAASSPAAASHEDFLREALDEPSPPPSQQAAAPAVQPMAAAPAATSPKPTTSQPKAQTPAPAAAASTKTQAPAPAAAQAAAAPDLLDAVFDEVHGQQQCIDEAILHVLTQQ